MFTSIFPVSRQTCLRFSVFIALVLALNTLVACGTAATSTPGSGPAPTDTPPPESEATAAPTSAPMTLATEQTDGTIPPDAPIPTPTPLTTDAAPSSATGRDDITIVLGAEPPYLDLIGSHGTEYATVFLDSLSDLLTWVDKDTKEFVGLSGITGWEQIDPARWRFSIRDGVKFHNGEPFTTEAAVFNVNAQGQPTGGTSFGYTGPISGAVVDAQSFDVICEIACPIFPRTAVKVGFQAPKWYTENPRDVTLRNTMGFGPYRLVDWTPAVEMNLEAYPDYTPAPGVFESQAPTIQHLKYLWRAENSVRAAMIQTGEAELAFNLGLEDEANVPVFHKTAAFNGMVNYLAIDTIWHPLLSKVEMRLALVHGWDCEEVVATILNNTTTCRGNVSTPDTLGITEENGQPYEYDPQLVQQYLEQAGYQGEPIVMMSRTVGWAGQTEVMEAIASYWIDNGINIDLQFVESGIASVARNCGIGLVRPEVKEARWTLTERRSDCVTPDMIDTGQNFSALDLSRFTNGRMSCLDDSGVICREDIETLRLKAQEASGEERKRLMEQLGDMIHNEALVMPLFDRNQFIGASDQLIWEPRGIDANLRVNVMRWE